MENIIVTHCAPTLAGLKTANLVNCKKDEAHKCITEYGAKLRKKGIETAVLSETDTSVLLYVYRRNRLEKDLENPETQELLRTFGYKNNGADGYIAHLRERIAENPCFPHEIGLFLGYPVEDVRGFIEHKGKDFKCMGYWKVYCNECEAKKTFARYKKCIDVYTRVYLDGASIEKLTVAV